MQMKVWLTCLIFAVSTSMAFGQKQLLSYDDLKFILINNLQKTDTFMTAKGYTTTSKSSSIKNRTCQAVDGSSHIIVDMRLDGKRLFVEMQTNELEQYDLIHNSIAQYITKDTMAADVQTYVVKDLGTIYITVNDTNPYDPLKREYDLHIVSDKQITAYN